MVSVIIVAAGNSSRMEGIKKQFLKIGGVPVVIRSVTKFQQIDEVCETIIVVGKEDIPYAEQLVQQYKLKNTVVTQGGDSRQQSVLSGLSCCNSKSDLVAIHDAARPFVQIEEIQQVIQIAKKYGAATLGAPVKDTIKIVEDGIIQFTPPRSSLYLTQTPQVFQMELYKKAVEKAQQNQWDFTDDCQLIEQYGFPVHIVTASYANIKITTPEDIVLAESFAKGEQQCE